jgi:hypothetical protein
MNSSTGNQSFATGNSKKLGTSTSKNTGEPNLVGVEVTRLKLKRKS